MSDAAFSGSIPQQYDRYLGPLIFEGYARDLARRVKAPPGGRVLETAAGTGIATRHLRDALADNVTILATDVNEAMVEVGRSRTGDGGTLEWRQADAMDIPLQGGAVDAVVCQFGMMFLPDKVDAAREAARVLRPGGSFVFNVWDSFAENPMVRTVDTTLERLYPGDPPGFLKIPFSWNDMEEIAGTLAEAGFEDIAFEVLPAESTAPEARHAALGFVTGTPVSADIAGREEGPSLDDVVDTVTAEIAREHGNAPARAKMQSILFTARRP